MNLTNLDGRCPDGYAPIQHPRFCNCAQVPAMKQAGIAAANSAPTDVKNRVDRAIIRLAQAGREFSANDLRTELVGVPGPVVGGPRAEGLEVGRMTTDFGHAHFILNQRDAWLADFRRELAADGYRDHAAAIAWHSNGVAESIVAMTGRGASS